jgi:hypothetical protein
MTDLLPASFMVAWVALGDDYTYTYKYVVIYNLH